MDFLTLGLITLGAGIVLWIIEKSWGRGQRTAPPGGTYEIMPPINREPAQSGRSSGEQTLTEMLQQFPDLPQPPSATALYDVWEAWFSEAKKRSLLETAWRTREQAIKLHDQVLRYELQFITHVQNQVQLKEITHLSALQLEAKEKALRVQIAEADAKIDAFKAKKPAAGPTETESDRRVRQAKQIEREKQAELREIFGVRNPEDLSDAEQERWHKIANYHDDRVARLYNK